MISQISECRNQFFEFASMFGLTKNMISVVKLINEGMSEAISCSQIHEIYIELK